MDNYAIAEQFEMLAKLMDIHGENSFKSKSYATAAFTLEKFPQNVAELPAEKINAIKGIGSSAGAKVQELLQTGHLSVLDELIAQTPPGVLEMMNIKGLGPKKINTLWKEQEIDTIAGLQHACQEGRIAAIKGFGDKTQEKILASIQFHQQNAGIFLYAQVTPFAKALTKKIADKFPDEHTEIAGDYRRQCEVVNELEWVSTVEAGSLKELFSAEAFALVSESEHFLEFRSTDGLLLRFHLCAKTNFGGTLFQNTGSATFLQAWNNAGHFSEGATEEILFTQAGMSFIPPYLRESITILERASNHTLPNVLQPADIKGLIHAHSNWSDGAHSIEEMARELMRLGFEYLVLSDHSKSAYYANGLHEDRIRQQHIEIDRLNQMLAPFRIFKSIECDILSDGALDYGNDILSSFDLVIASIHSNLDMPEEKAMMRLMGAINNPYITIMGHLTGRLLARRPGYPVDHKAIIDACAERNVVIEINASPSRLDMDWRWVGYALEKGVLLSVNPDAHSFEDIRNLPYGVAVAQKGGLTKERNLSSYSLVAFEEFLKNRQK